MLHDHADIVPGTVHLIDLPGQHTEAGHAGNRKDIVLVPHPSADPEDPLNWTRRRKFWALAMVFVYTLGVGIPTTLHYSVLADITASTGITTTDLVQGNGVMFLFLGWACLLWQPIALTYGRRGVYLLSCLLTVPIMVWTGYTTSAGEWYAHRVIIGIACAPIEALPEISIPDVFYAHERGTWMSTYVLVLFGSNFIAPLIAGWFDDAFGWRWTMFFGAIVSAAAFVILFFGMEETMYFRNTVEGVEADSESSSPPPMVAEVEKGGEKSATPELSDTDKEVPPPAFQQQKPFLQRLKIFQRVAGSPTVMQMLHMMYRPLLIIVNFPNVAWAGFIYGINLSWYQVLNGTASPVLSARPYNWSAALVGCIYVGPIIGAILGCLLSGTLADRLALYLARKYNGIREPEQRLWPLSVAGIMCAAGLITWGVGAYHDVHWVGLAFGLGMMVFGLVIGGSIGLSYAVDCFKEISGESMASVIVIRNTMGFGFSYAITPWYTNMGLQNCFITAGFVALACMSTFLLIIWKGKALRRASAKTYWKYVESSSVAGAH
jgi:MFS family permease